MPHAPIEHVGDGLEPAVGVRGKTGDVLTGLVGTELVQQQEGIEVGEVARADDARQAHAGAVRGCLPLEATDDLARFRAVHDGFSCLL